MNTKEKNMFIGAAACGLADLGLEGYWAWTKYSGFPYETAHPVLPPWDDWIALFGTPGIAYIASRVSKSPRTKQTLLDIAKGAAVYGIPTWIGILIARLIWQSGQQSPGQFTFEWEHPVTNIIRQAKPSPHFTPGPHTGENLPFQTDMEY
ncbi:MAG: hypothetical protein ACE5L6_02095 [Candidatus Bathyarchaeia archaeon]